MDFSPQPVRLVICVFLLLLLAAIENVWTRQSFVIVARRGSQKDIGGLLPPRLEGDECISRLEHHLYYGHNKDDKPSEYFISKVRGYEKMHQRCAKEADKFTQFLSSNFSSPDHGWESDCRVLLLDRGTDMPQLFCEPFANASWFVPVSFPHDYVHGLNMDSANKLGKLLKTSQSGSYEGSQKRAGISCRSSMAVHKGRCLLHPASLFHRLVPRGVPEDVSRSRQGVPLHCKMVIPWLDTRSGLLIHQKPLTESGSRRMSKDQSSSVINVLVVSLFQRYYDRFKDFYLQQATWNQSIVVKVHFASHEDIQQTDDLEHDKKAVMEVYLLAMCDVLVTTSRSTYGYIAQGYGGVRPWTIAGAFGDTEAGTSEPCFRMSAIEPCFLRGQFFDCDGKRNTRLPEGVKPCQDAPWAIRIREGPAS